MATIPGTVGYSPTRWQKTVAALLLKTEGDYRVHKTRPIPLIEADANHSFKQLARMSYNKAVKYNLLASEQYGSKEDSSASHLSSVKQMVCDLSRQMKTPIAICSTDAKSCYDRIVHVAAFLALRRLGISTPIIQSMFMTIQNMQHHIRTSFGDSKGSFGGKEYSLPPRGSIQGNGASPLLWAAISSILFLCLRKRGKGATFISPITSEAMKIMGFAFVDDTDLIQTAPLGDTGTQAMIESMQGSMDIWQGTLRTTGGALDWADNNKCYWYCISYDWNKYGRWSYTDSSAVHNLTMLDDNSNRQTIHQCAVSEARKTLGIRFAPNGDTSVQKDYMRDVAEQFANKIRSGSLRGHDAYVAMQSRIMKTLEYPLPTITLSEHDCKYIMAPIISCVTNKLQIMRNIRRDLLYGTTKYQGFGWDNLYVKMGSMQIARLVQFGGTKTDLGKLQEQTLQCMIMELGLSGNPFTHDYSTLQFCVTKCTLQHVWEFCNKYNITLHRKFDYFSEQRKGDSLLMETFIAHGYTGATLGSINRCRVYLRVLWTSDIVTADGYRIIKDCYKGRKWPCYTTKYEWPKQEKPGPNDWVHWRKAIHKCFDPFRPSLLLPHSQYLSDWNKDLPQSHWVWWYDVANNIIYKRLSNGLMRKYMQYEHSRRGRIKVYIRCGEHRINGTHFTICTVAREKINCEGRIILTGFGELESSDIFSPPPPDFVTYLTKQCSPEAWVLNKFTVVGNIIDLIEELGKGTLRAVSDGSCDSALGIGTAGWSIIGTKTIIRGVNIIPIGNIPMDSMRTELGGIYTIVKIVEHLGLYHHVQAGSVTVGSDCDSALNRTLMRMKHSSLNYITGQHIDLVNAINGITRNSLITFHGQVIAGHQDKATLFQNLTWWEQRNVEMDWLAKTYMQMLRRDQQTNDSTSVSSTESWGVFVGKTKITGNIIKSTHDEICGNNILAYWIEKKRFHSDDVARIDWMACTAARQTLSFNRQIWLSKHVSGYFATGTNMLLWKKRDTAECPLCNHTETKDHIVLCQSTHATAQWLEGIDQFEHVLSKIKTPKETSAVISYMMKRYRNNTSDIPHITNPTLKAAVLSQHSLGWGPFLEGLLVKEWVTHASTFMTKKKNPNTWVQALIINLWEIIWNMWNKRCTILHRTDLSNKLHELDLIDTQIRGILDIHQSNLLPHEKSLFLTTHEEMEEKTPKYRRLWLQKADKIIARRDARVLSPSFYRNERQTMQVWLQADLNHPVPTQTPVRSKKKRSTLTQLHMTSWIIHDHEIS